MDYSLLDNNVKKRHLNWSSDISTCSSITCQYLCLKDMLPYESLEITFDYELLVPIRLSEQLANVLPNLEKNMLEGLAKHFYLDSCAFESNSNLITGLSYLPQDIISVTNGTFELIDFIPTSTQLTTFNKYTCRWRLLRNIN